MEINKYIDYTNLNNISFKEVKKIAQEASENQFAGICIQPNLVMSAKDVIRRIIPTGTDEHIKLITVPNWTKGGGYWKINSADEMACEIADEVDYVINTYMMFELKNWDRVIKELSKIRKISKVLKVIIEANYVRISHPTENKKLLKQAIQFAEKCKADYIKTDSGLFKRDDINTLYEDVSIIKRYTKLKIKAAGGVRTLDQVKRLIELGVDRIGTSVNILKR